MTTETIRAFHGDMNLKADAIARMRAHAAADAIIQSTYLAVEPSAPGGYQGCFYGCLVADLDPAVRAAIAAGDDDAEPDDGWHAAAERLLGLPQRFGRLAEDIFEALPPEEAPDFAVALIKAIPAGTDLDRVIDEMVIAVLSDPERGCRQYAEPDSQAAIDTIVELYRRRLVRDEPSDAEWSAATAAAWSAWSAAWSAGSATAAKAAAAWSATAATAATAAAWSATRSAARSVWYAARRAGSAEAAARRWQADTLIALTTQAVPAEAVR